MTSISYSDLRQNLKDTILTVNDTHQPVYITNRRQPQAVLMAYEDFQGLEETAYLLKSPKMAKRLLQALENLEAGKFETHGLLDDET